VFAWTDTSNSEHLLLHYNNPVFHSMPRFSKECEQLYRERIRGIMIVKPKATLQEIREALSQSSSPLELSEDYIGRIRKKIVGERANRVGRLNAAVRIAEIQDKHRLVEEILWQEARETKHGMVRIAALGKILQNDVELFQIEKDAGFFDSPKNTPRRKQLSKEALNEIVRVMKLWGIFKDPESEEDMRQVEAAYDCSDL
jgi:hypothetical protein